MARIDAGHGERFTHSRSQVIAAIEGYLNDSAIRCAVDRAVLSGPVPSECDHSLGDDCVGCGDPDIALIPGDFAPINQSNDQTKVGWTVGGGAELLHNTHWVRRAEALCVDLGSETHSYTVQGNPPNFPGLVATLRAETISSE
jgi:hypothetical protein